ncbi:MAG: TSUP family transporter, partial [Oscillospiraceae bacterium]|nr:TSUP family transporter [Oscillospiraceae bacterium]
MFMYAIYFIVFLLSCLLGAIVGLGGGVIIRPILDAIGYHNVMNLAFLSSAAILVMAIVSTYKKAKDGMKLEVSKAVLISLGALAGGALGDQLLQYLVRTFALETTVQTIQAVTNIVILSAAIYFTSSDRFRYELKSKALYP